MDYGMECWSQMGPTNIQETLKEYADMIIRSVPVQGTFGAAVNTNPLQYLKDRIAANGLWTDEEGMYSTYIICGHTDAILGHVYDTSVLFQSKNKKKLNDSSTLNLCIPKGCILWKTEIPLGSLIAVTCFAAHFMHNNSPNLGFNLLTGIILTLPADYNVRAGDRLFLQ